MLAIHTVPLKAFLVWNAFGLKRFRSETLSPTWSRRIHRKLRLTSEKAIGFEKWHHFSHYKTLIYLCWRMSSFKSVFLSLREKLATQHTECADPLRASHFRKVHKGFSTKSHAGQFAGSFGERQNEEERTRGRCSVSRVTAGESWYEFPSESCTQASQWAPFGNYIVQKF